MMNIKHKHFEKEVTHFDKEEDEGEEHETDEMHQSDCGHPSAW